MSSIHPSIPPFSISLPYFHHSVADRDRQGEPLQWTISRSDRGSPTLSAPHTTPSAPLCSHAEDVSGGSSVAGDGSAKVGEVWQEVLGPTAQTSDCRANLKHDLMNLEEKLAKPKEEITQLRSKVQVGAQRPPR
jgi:hypothetical protein